MDYSDLPAVMAQHDAYRPVDWRWQRARHWARRTDRRGWKAEDDWTRETAIAIRPRPDWYRPPAAFAKRLERIHAAVALSECHPEHSALRQAWLLTGLATADVAARMQESAESVDWYERLFFDVRNRLNVDSAILLRAIGHQPPPGRFRRAWVLRWLAYFGGAVVLEAALPLLLPERAHTAVAAAAPPELKDCLAVLLADGDQPYGPEMLGALLPLFNTSPPKSPLGTDWRSGSRSQLTAALAAVTPPSSRTGQDRTA